MAIVTDKYIAESSVETTIDTTEQVGDGINYSIFKFKDGSYCRPVFINGESQMVECDKLGDIWFTLPDAALDQVLPEDVITSMIEAYGDSYINYNSTTRSLHKYIVSLDNGFSQLKSGIYPDGLTRRKLPTFDAEFQFYFDNFGVPDGSNISAVCAKTEL